MNNHDRQIEVLEEEIKFEQRRLEGLGSGSYYENIRTEINTLIKALTYFINLKQPRLEELDEGKIREIMNDIEGVVYLEKSEDKIDRVHANIMRNNHKAVAHAICQKFGKQPKRRLSEEKVEKIKGSLMYAFPQGSYTNSQIIAYQNGLEKLTKALCDPKVDVYED